MSTIHCVLSAIFVRTPVRTLDAYNASTPLETGLGQPLTSSFEPRPTNARQIVPLQVPTFPILAIFMLLSCGAGVVLADLSHFLIAEIDGLTTMARRNMGVMKISRLVVLFRMNEPTGQASEDLNDVEHDTLPPFPGALGPGFNPHLPSSNESMDRLYCSAIFAMISTLLASLPIFILMDFAILLYVSVPCWESVSRRLQDRRYPTLFHIYTFARGLVRSLPTIPGDVFLSPAERIAEENDRELTTITPQTETHPIVLELALGKAPEEAVKANLLN